MTNALTISEIGQCIFSVRGHQVIMDNDLASFYRVETKILNKAVRRNVDRFPEDFKFQLSRTEYESIRLQRGTSSQGWGEHRKYLPQVFTEQGAVMLSSVLNSDRAIEIHIAITRAFVEYRRSHDITLMLSKKLEQIEHGFFRLEQKYDSQSRALQEAIYKSNPGQPRPPTTNEKFPLENPPKQVKLKNQVSFVLKAVANYYGIKVDDLMLETRVKRIVHPRQVAIYLIRKHARLPYKEIGTLFGGKDHSTIINAYRKITLLITHDQQVQEELREIEENILSPVPAAHIF